MLSACLSCPRALPASALDRILFGWVAVGPAWVCKVCKGCSASGAGR